MHPPPPPPPPPTPPPLSLDANPPPRSRAPLDLISAITSVRDGRQKVEDEIASLTQYFADRHLPENMDFDSDEHTPPLSNVTKGMDPDQNSLISMNDVDSRENVAIRENGLSEEQIAIETRFYTLCFDAEQLKVEEEDLLKEIRGEEREGKLAEEKASNAIDSRVWIQNEAKIFDGDARGSLEGLEENEEEESQVKEMKDSDGQTIATENLESKLDSLRKEGKTIMMENQEIIGEEKGQAMSIENSGSKEKSNVFFRDEEQEETSRRSEERGQEAEGDQGEGEELQGQGILEAEGQHKQQRSQVEEQVGQVSIEEENQQGGHGEQQIDHVSIEEENEQGDQAITVVVSEHRAYYTLRSIDEATLQCDGGIEDVSTNNSGIKSTNNLEENDEGIAQERHMHELESRISELFKQKASLENANAELQDALLKLRSDVQINEDKTQRLVRIKEDIKKLEGFLEEAKEKAMALARKEEGLTTRIQELSVVADGSKSKGTKFPSPLVISGSTIVIVGLLVLFWHSRSKSAK